MSNAMKSFVEKRLAELGMNPFEAARNGGLERGYINDIIQGKKRTIKGENMVRLANALKVSMRDFIIGTSDTNIIEPALDWIDQNYKHLEDFSDKKPAPREAETVRRDNKEYVPLYFTAVEVDRNVNIEERPMSYIRAPDPIYGISGAFALMVYGDAMAPEMESGDKALIHPKLPPVRNKTCIFSNKSAGGRRMIVARLIDNLEKHWLVKQWNPNREFTLEKDAWPICQRIVGVLTA